MHSLASTKSAQHAYSLQTTKTPHAGPVRLRLTNGPAHQRWASHTSSQQIPRRHTNKFPPPGVAPCCAPHPPSEGLQAKLDCSGGCGGRLGRAGPCDVHVAGVHERADDRAHHKNGLGCVDQQPSLVVIGKVPVRDKQ
jgi:hypothetical protein